MMNSSNGILSALLHVCAGISPVTDEFPSQRPVTRSLDVFFDLRLHKRLNKQWYDWGFETPSRSLWRHCNYHIKTQVMGMTYKNVKFSLFSIGIHIEYHKWQKVSFYFYLTQFDTNNHLLCLCGYNWTVPSKLLFCRSINSPLVDDGGDNSTASPISAMSATCSRLFYKWRLNQLALI